MLIKSEVQFYQSVKKMAVLHLLVLTQPAS